ncbi:MAG: ABC transporter substrate-binding protein [Kineosporiaceae bacterium]|nr:ABC transporter substrate-binding protein [Kineosporiaceae bacterium]
MVERVSRRTAIALGAALSVTMALTACGGSDSGGSSASSGGVTKVSVGVIPIVDVAPLYLGIQKGFFAKAGLEVSAKPAQGGAAIVPAVISGENQFGFSNVVSLLTARDKGLPLVSIAAGVSSTGDPADDVNAVLVGKGSTLKTAKDLEGRKIAVNSLNNIGDTTVKTAVTKAGGDPAKVTFVEMPFPDMPAQLAAGTIDAAWEAEPFRTQIVAAGGRILFDNLTETYPTLQISHYFTSAQTKQKNPAMVTAFVTAINESMTYAAAHPDEVRAVLATYTKISPDVAAKMSLPDWPTAIDRDSLTAVGTAARTYGTLTKDPDVAGLLGG